MVLKDEIQKILNDVENSTSEDILKVISQIQPQFRSKLTSEYLQGKIQKIIEITDESEKKKQCCALLPYFDWYLQGL
jgi:hypothetical protein